jgi:hypothetical protein
VNKRSYYLVKKIYKRRSGIAVKIGEKVPFKQTPTIPIRFDNKETVIELNGMNIEAYPSHFLDAIRGLPKVYFIFLDEHPPMHQKAYLKE